MIRVRVSLSIPFSPRACIVSTLLCTCCRCIFLIYRVNAFCMVSGRFTSFCEWPGGCAEVIARWLVSGRQEKRASTGGKGESRACDFCHAPLPRRDSNTVTAAHGLSSSSTTTTTATHS